MIDLSFGIPDPNLLPLTLIKEVINKIIGDIKSIQYGPVEGYAEAREAIAKLMKLRGVEINKDQVVLTSGAKEALFIISFLIKRDLVIEEPTYQGFISMLKFFGKAPTYTIPLDEKGIKTEELEKALKQGIVPSSLYTVTINNPTGCTSDEERKKHLLELAEDYDFKIIEDDIYGFYCFEGDCKPLKYYDKNHRVIYVSSVSKIISPGLRIGYIVADEEDTINRIRKIKGEINHQVSSLDQLIVKEVINDSRFIEYLNIAKEKYKLKRDKMTYVMEKIRGVECTKPRGGFFMFCKGYLPKGIKALDGSKFFYDESEGSGYYRLSYSNMK